MKNAHYIFLYIYSLSEEGDKTHCPIEGMSDFIYEPYLHPLLTFFLLVSFNLLMKSQACSRIFMNKLNSI